MKISPKEAVRRYNMIREELKSKCPEQWAVVVELCRNLPEKIDIDVVWRFGRDKPCYSNIRVGIGERLARDIGRSEDFGNWGKIASDDWAIGMIEPGRRWKRNANFKIEGRAAQDFVSSLDQGGLRSYLWKLYCIRELALALKQNRLNACIQTLEKFDKACGGIPLDEVKAWTTQFGRLAGFGWGHTTAYHMLTDLAVSVKPDMHLTKSVIFMGLLEPDYSSHMPEDELSIAIKNPHVQHLAAKSAMELSKWITPEANPANPRSRMREVDKVLMEWSRQGLARPL